MLSRIREFGRKAGVVLNPASPVAFAQQLHLCDVVLVMTVNPGFAGQAFLPEMLPKFGELRALCREKENGEHAREAIAAGADAIVAGSTIFKSHDYAAAIANLRCQAMPAFESQPRKS